MYCHISLVVARKKKKKKRKKKDISQADFEDIFQKRKFSKYLKTKMITHRENQDHAAEEITVC